MADYFYASEKFSAARRLLMLPHTKGEAASIASAFHECSLGLDGINRAELDDEPRRWVEKLDELMDTTNVPDDPKNGRWYVKASRMSSDDMLELSRVVDELAWWFNDKARDAVR